MASLGGVEDLALFLLGIPDGPEDDDDVDDLLMERFGVDLEQFAVVVEALLPLCMVARGALSDQVYHGFADREDNLWLVKKPYDGPKAGG